MKKIIEKLFRFDWTKMSKRNVIVFKTGIFLGKNDKLVINHTKTSPQKNLNEIKLAGKVIIKATKGTHEDTIERTKDLINSRNQTHY